MRLARRALRDHPAYCPARVEDFGAMGIDPTGADREGLDIIAADVQEALPAQRAAIEQALPGLRQESEVAEASVAELTETYLGPALAAYEDTVLVAEHVRNSFLARIADSMGAGLQGAGDATDPRNDLATAGYLGHRLGSLAELEALLRAVPDDDWGGVERVLYLAAGMTGRRTGELLGLRWMDVDWTARRVRVRQTWVRGEYTTPKSARGSRSVPLAARVAAALDELSGRTAYPGDGDLVFGHPQLGQPLDRSKLRKRSRRRSSRPRCGKFGSTTSGTPSEPASRPPACRCARCRNGWGIATTRRR